MRAGIIRLVQPPFLYKALRQSNPTTHCSSWTSNWRTKISVPQYFPRFDFQFSNAVEGTIGLSWGERNLGAVNCGAARSGPSRKQFDLCTAARMTTVSVDGEPEKYNFGQWKIDVREVFLITEHCYCFVNLRPVVPGHVLVTTKRLVPRFTDLTAEEVTDLWLTVQRVGQKLEPFFEGTSLTLSLQDGPEAGQTVPHVHVHVLPRKKNDFENNDEIYDELDKKEKELNEELKKEQKHLDLDEERKDRTREEMFEEAARLRALFI